MVINMLKWCPNSYPSATHKITQLHNNLKLFRSTHSPLRSFSAQSSISTHDDVQVPSSSPFTGLDETMTGFIFGKKKATEVAHAVWNNVVRKGDLVVDATCGNGHDTVAMARLVADDAGRGCVFAMDLQKSALESTSSLLDQSLTPHQVGFGRARAFAGVKAPKFVKYSESASSPPRNHAFPAPAIHTSAFQRAHFTSNSGIFRVFLFLKASRFYQICSYLM
ncbi:uncharacterized protein LOC121791069 [Salvia splendens]|uniref:uncharacterized protein LOC121791069 n=1 Tax=Salvia splendens TaxID=180675 RepID=UPI001C275283|nr:uncharacterized protein LOC121791069 [Salvia splendens]